MSASVKVSPGAISIEGETFQPTPRSRAQTAPVPSLARPPAPGAPVKFSGEIERETRSNVAKDWLRLTPRPSNSLIGNAPGCVRAGRMFELVLPRMLSWAASPVI